MWEELLSEHPDRAFTGYIVRGIQQGFRIGFHPGQCRLKTSPANMPSAEEYPEVVSEYIGQEVTQGQLVELEASTAKALDVHTSLFGVIPKKSKPNKW